jgi:hypothetical protein
LERLLPPINESGEIEQDLGLTPVTTPITDTNTDASGQPEENSQPSSEQDTTPTDGPKSMADAIAEALASGDDSNADNPDTAEGEKPKSEDEKSEADADADAEAAKTPGTDTSKEPAEEKADPDDSDPTDEELKGYQPKVQKRIRKLLSQRNEVRREAEELRPDATHYRNIRQFMAEANLEDGEMAELFKVGRLLKGNDIAGFEQALDIVLPIAQQLLEATGRALPTELREKVESGEITEEAARDLARQRTRATTAERRATVVEKQAQTQQQQAQTLQHRTAVQTAVATWEQRIRQSDPDFGLKADAMRDAALALVAEKGAPKTPQEAVDMAKAAYDRVNAWFRKARPAAKPSTPAPSNGPNGNRSSLTPAPASLKDAIFGALRSSQT